MHCATEILDSEPPEFLRVVHGGPSKATSSFMPNPINPIYSFDCYVHLIRASSLPTKQPLHIPPTNIPRNHTPSGQRPIALKTQKHIATDRETYLSLLIYTQITMEGVGLTSHLSSLVLFTSHRGQAPARASTPAALRTSRCAAYCHLSVRPSSQYGLSREGVQVGGL